MLQDIRLTFRTLRKHKGFALAALLTLALGIGANTAIFSVVYGVLLRPLPYPAPDRIVQLSEVVPGGTPALPGATWISNLTIDAWSPERAPEPRSIGPIATFSSGTATVGLDVPERVPRGFVSPLFFDVLGVRPVVGRFFRHEDGVQGAAPVVVLSDAMWREHYGRDGGAVGRTLLVDDRPHEIIGIAPPGIGMPAADVRLWAASVVPPPLSANSRDVRVEGTRAIARLTAGSTPARAAAEGTTLARGVTRPLAAEMLFGKGGPVEVHVRTLADQMTVRVRPALLTLLVGVGLLLLIACANVANLFISRGVSRERELAVRAALGAGHARLLRGLLAESLVIAMAGGLIGVALAWALVRALPAAAPATFPRLDSVDLDWRSLGFAVAVSLVAAILAGLLPALRGARPDLLMALREGTGASSSRRTARLRRALLVMEASIALMLLIGATLLARSFVRLVQTDAGYDVSNVLTARIYLPGASRGQAQTDAFVTELLARLRARPLVTAAGVGNMAPFGTSTFVAGFTVPLPGREPVRARALQYVVSPGYAEALKLQLRGGRHLEERDLASGTQAILVNEQFVKTFLQGTDPFIVRFSVSFAANVDPKPTQIVGVVGNVLKDSLDQQPQAEFYVLPVTGAAIRREINLVLRTANDPLAHAAAVRAIVRELRPEAAVDNVTPLADQVSASVAQPRFAAAVLLACAGLALLLAAIGLYGVLSYTVARRKREIGVRSALGASRSSLVGLVLREGMGVTLAGLALGLLGAAGLTRLMQTLLVGVEPLDPLSFALAPAVLVVVALVACVVPARRAAAVDPAIALRYE